MADLQKDYPVNRLKNWLRGAYRSMTIWFNSITGTLAAAIPLIPEYLPDLKPYLTQNAYMTLLIINIVGNILLRAKTKTALPEKGQ